MSRRDYVTWSLLSRLPRRRVLPPSVCLNCLSIASSCSASFSFTFSLLGLKHGTIFLSSGFSLSLFQDIFSRSQATRQVQQPVAPTRGYALDEPGIVRPGRAHLKRGTSINTHCIIRSEFVTGSPGCIKRSSCWGTFLLYPVSLACRETNLSMVVAFGTPLHLRWVLTPSRQSSFTGSIYLYPVSLAGQRAKFWVCWWLSGHRYALVWSGRSLNVSIMYSDMHLISVYSITHHRHCAAVRHRVGPANENAAAFHHYHSYYGRDSCRQHRSPSCIGRRTQWTRQQVLHSMHYCTITSHTLVHRCGRITDTLFALPCSACVAEDTSPLQQAYTEVRMIPHPQCPHHLCSTYIYGGPHDPMTSVRNDSASPLQCAMCIYRVRMITWPQWPHHLCSMHAYMEVRMIP